jgi:RNA polymerase sigma-70 factor, ECF subfamily
LLVNARVYSRGAASTLSRPASDTRTVAVEADFLDCVGVFEDQFDYVYHALRRHGISPTDAEDLVQEVFLVMWRRWSEYDSSRPLRPWLGGIAFRVAYNYRQRSGREVPGGIVDAEDEAPSPEDRLDAHSARALVLRVLAALPEKYRALIVSHDLDGVPMREIADTLRVPLFTAHTRLRAARLAFAKAVRRLQAVTEARVEMAARLRAQALLAAERSAAPPAPPARRRRAVARARAMVPPIWPTQPPPPHPRAGWPLGLGVATLAVAAVGLVGWKALAPRPRTAASRTAHVAPAHARPAPPDPRSAAALARGVVGYWRFDDGPGSTVARDSSGNGNHCLLRQLRPSDWTDGPLGGAIVFTNEGWLECPHPEALARIQTAMSISLWIKRTGSKGHVRALVTRAFEGTDRDRFHLGFSDDDLVLRSRAQGRSTYAPFPAVRGHWLHVAATRGADGISRLYIDGEEIRSKFSDQLVMGGGNDPLIIGGGNNTSDPDHVKEHLQGVMDELIIYDRALGPEEVAALAAGTQPELQ